MTVLVVDDHPAICRGLKRLLELEGFQAACAGSGQEAMAVVAADPPRMIVLDLMMPDMDGIQVLRELRSRPATADLPVIMFTATDDTDQLDEVRRMGAEVMAKGLVSWGEIVARVSRRLGTAAVS